MVLPLLEVDTNQSRDRTLLSERAETLDPTFLFGLEECFYCCPSWDFLPSSTVLELGVVSKGHRGP